MCQKVFALITVFLLGCAPTYSIRERDMLRCTYGSPVSCSIHYNHYRLKECKKNPESRICKELTRRWEASLEWKMGGEQKDEVPEAYFYDLED